MVQKKIYFPNLNGIRFIAAFLVIIYHIEQIKSIFKLPSFYEGSGLITRIISIIGPQGVVLFFVLSGFLITYLLLTEESRTNSINVRKFYIRRILRIWPLYLLIVIASLLILVHFDLFLWPGYEKYIIQQNIYSKLLLYVFFFANLVLTFFGIIPFASQTWSIGTEEQFYLAWPLVMKFIRKNRSMLMISIIIFYNLISLFLSTPIFNSFPGGVILRAFWSGFTIDCMAVGGFFAVILFQKHALLKCFLNNSIFYLSLFVVIICYSRGVHFPHFNSIVYSGLYGIILLNFAANKSIYISFENKVFNYLGNISYGLYMLHPIGITLAIRLSMKINIVNNLIIYPFSLLFTIVLSSLSYHFFESYFLKFKSGFAIVKSGSE
jgi:peptidoglycan/LPS O-acetylase OafA/YrhL